VTTTYEKEGVVNFLYNDSIILNYIDDEFDGEKEKKNKNT
jgi:hypothetical protein